MEVLMHRYGKIDADGKFTGEFYHHEGDPLDERLQRKVSVLPVTVCDEGKSAIYYDRMAPVYTVEGGKIVETFPYAIKADLVEALKKRINDIRQEREQSGVRWQFGDTTDVIQTRDAVDWRNLNARMSAAMFLQAQGITDPVMTFRAQSDTSYMLTPAEMITMCLGVSAAFDTIYQYGWDLKERIDVLADDPDALLALDLEEGWPE